MQSFFDFINNSPTSFHAVDQIASGLMDAGVIELFEDKKFALVPGQRYLVKRNDSSLVAFSLPMMKPQGYKIYAAHSDSPCFKLKPNPEMKVDGTYVMLNTEKYGGMILSTWLDRPLSIAGRVTILEENKIVTKLVNMQDYTCVIPNLAIHMNRDMNKGVEYNPQTDMRPLVGLEQEDDNFLSLLAQDMGVTMEDILGYDLYVYAKESCIKAGYQEELILGPRLDDLECAYAGLRGFVDAIKQTDQRDAKDSCIQILAVFDNEEVGSGTKQGADSTFLTDILDRIEEALQFTGEERKCMRASSFMISADNAHALHPNHPEKADPTNRPVLNGGLVIKYHGGQKYTTDAYSEAIMKSLCKQAGVSYQTYANRSDLAGGSTLGNIVTAHLSIPTVDIGLPQLAMHSAFETAGAKDLEDLCKVVTLYFS